MAANDGAIRFQALPPEEAIAYFKAKGYNLAESWDWRDFWQAQHATSFTVAKSAGFDVLKDIQAAVDDAISRGLTLKQFSAQLTPILQQKGWWGKKELPDPLTGEVREVQLGSPRRLRIIYDTNMRMSQAAGEWARVQRTKRSAPYLLYSAILDGVTRPLHRAWNGTILPVDHAWWKTHFPPNGWRCRCSTIQLSAFDLEALGYQVSADPEDDLVMYTNDRTGETQMIPRGIDPGFAYNPGEAALDGHAARALMGKLVDASPDMAAAQAASARFVVPALKRDLAEWIAPRLDALEAGTPIKTGERRVVGALPDEVLEFFTTGRATAGGQAVELASGAVTLSEEGIAHLYREAKRGSGVGLARETIERAVDALWEPEAIYWDKNSPALLYLVDAGEAKGKLVVRVNYAAKVKVPAESGKVRRAAVTTNDLWSGRIIDPADLENAGMYERIK
ncbi:MAG: phage minor head protein [Solidesulfovibrio sp. DCME]|uniref:phage head morphogenesis protein n=1 Tax=Solidesulfovibrio sp. DCME TaxID=3447380 RepID=UPI003D147406